MSLSKVVSIFSTVVVHFSVLYLPVDLQLGLLKGVRFWNGRGLPNLALILIGYRA